MKKILYIVVAAFVFACSGSQDMIEQSINYVNPYEITNNPDDPVQSKRYELYTTYGVPVYFNDTIAQLYIRDDFNGNPIYKYETLDLAWSFYGYERATYNYTYITEQAEQLRALEYAEYYLKNAPKSLYPTNFYLVKDYRITDTDNKTTIHSDLEYKIGFRTLTIANAWSDNETITSHTNDVQIQMLKEKIYNYTAELSPFYEASDDNWYYAEWEKLDPTYYNYVDTEILTPDALIFVLMYIGRKFMTIDAHNTFWPYSFYLTPEQFAGLKKEIVIKMGQFGFIGYGTSGYSITPTDSGDDLEMYVNAITSLGVEGFKAIWEEQPLVMEKFDIVNNLIIEKFGKEF